MVREQSDVLGIDMCEDKDKPIKDYLGTPRIIKASIGKLTQGAIVTKDATGKHFTVSSI